MPMALTVFREHHEKPYWAGFTKVRYWPHRAHVEVFIDSIPFNLQPGDRINMTFRPKGDPDRNGKPAN